MKTAQVHLKTNVNLHHQLQVLEQIDPNLLFVFGTHEAFKKEGLAAQVSKHFPKALVVGCSTAGEITNDGVYDNTLVVTGSHFDQPDFRPAKCRIESMDSSHEAGRNFAKQFDKKNLKAVFVLGRGLQINGSALIAGIREMIGNEVVLTGGLAGDGGRFEQTFTLLNGETADDEIVGFGIYGDHFEVGYGSMGGWAPFGPVRRVTKSHQNVLFELDGQPALDIYKKYLGDKAKDLPASGLLFPFALLKDNQDETGIIRTILGVDEKEKSLIFAGDIPANGIVRLMHTTNDGLINGAKGAAEWANGSRTDSSSVVSTSPKNTNSLGILISCVGRKLIMGDEIEEELDAVRDVLGTNTVAGFYSYGEICAKSGFNECKLHNQTMTITYISEKKAA